MAIRKYKPTTPGRRGSSVSDFAEITARTPEKSLLAPIHSKGGRNVHGRVTTRHQGGGHKRQYQPGRLPSGSTRTACPRRSRISSTTEPYARIALLHYADGEKRYIIAPKDLQQGDAVESGPGADIRTGQTTCRCATSRSATTVHAVELRPGGGAKLARSAGVGIQLLGRESDYATLRNAVR